MCPFCKAALPNGASVCGSCGAQKMTRADYRARSLPPIVHLLTACVWLSTVGFVWGMVLLFAFFPAVDVYQVGGNPVLERTNWYCGVGLERTYHNNLKFPGAPPKTIKTGFSLPYIQTWELTPPFEDLFAYIFGHRPQAVPDCKVAGWREKVEKGNAETQAYFKSQGLRVTTKIVAEPVASRMEQQRRGPREPPSWLDYVVAVLWALAVLLVGVPLGRMASAIWRALCGSSSDLLWVR